jgi:hypothetical protein
MFIAEIEKKIKTIFFLLFLAMPFYSLAMQSETYKIPADTVNSGGNLSDSASYNLGDSTGEAAVGVESSTNYKSKTAFWYMLPSYLDLSCEAVDVYMVDYTLGNADNYSKYIFSTSQECTVVDNSSYAWHLTIQSSNMTSAQNNLANSNIFLSTNGNPSSEDTVTDPITGITEPSTSEYSLNTTRTLISASTSASGTYKNRPTIKLSNLNTLYSETISGTITVTIISD